MRGIVVQILASFDLKLGDLLSEGLDVVGEVGPGSWCFFSGVTSGDTLRRFLMPDSSFE